MPPIPPVTKNLMLACTAILCLEYFIPLEGQFALYSLGTGHFMPWQVVTYAFLHGGIAHLFFNMLGLWMFGAELEMVWGQRRYLQFLLAGVLFGGAAQLLLSAATGTDSVTIGASAAIYALLLAYVLTFPRRQFDLVGFLPMLLLMIPSPVTNIIGAVLYVMLLTNRAAVPIPPLPVRALPMVAIFGVLELVLGFYGGGGVAHFAHLGGMLGGYLMLRFWRGLPPFTRRRR
jgi:membrane associated rhomboid family serine protease